MTAFTHLEIYPGPVLQPSTFQEFTQISHIDAAEWGVDEHQVERRWLATQKPERVAIDDRRTLTLELLQNLLQLVRCGSMTLNKPGLGCSPRQGFQAQCAGAGEKIQAAHPVNNGHQPIEKRLSYTISGWPNVGIGMDWNASAAPLSTDDPDATRPG